LRTLRTKLRRDIARQRAQFAAIAVTIFLGVTLFGASYDAYRNLDASYREAFTEFHFANLTVTGGRTEAIAERARATPGVEAVTERVQADVPLEVGRTEFLGRVIGLPADGQPEVNQVDLQRGSYLKRGSPGGVLVEQHMADNFDLEPGDSVLARRPDGAAVRLRVLGIAASPEYFWPARSRQDIFPAPDDFGVVFAPEPLAEELAGADGPNQLAVYYEGGEEDAGLTAGLTRQAGRAGAADVLTREQQPSNSALDEDLKGFEELAVMFPLLFLTAAALATAVLLRRLVTAQRPIVGMLRACGYSRGQITRHYLGYGLIAGIVAGVLGAGVGLLLAGAVTRLYTSELEIPVSLAELHPTTPLIGVAFGLLTGLLAAGAPASLAARIPPAEAMRRFAPAGGGRLSLPERLLPPLRRLPVRWRMSLRSIGRNRRRTFATAAGVVLALILILVSWGMVDTADILVNRQFKEVERQDAQLFFEGPASREQLERIRRTAGVARAEPGLEAPASLASDDERYQTALVALRRDTSMHEFLAADGGTTALPASGLLAGKSLRDELGIGVGDRVRLNVPASGIATTARVEGFVDEPFGTYVYESLEAARSLGGAEVGAGNMALVSFEPGVDRDQMRRRLSDVPGVVAYEDSQALLDTVNGYLSLYYAFVGVMLLFGAAMAFALMFNAINSSIAERSVEVATMRAAGTPYRSLARVIAAENALVTALGILPGLVAGYLVAGVFMDSFSSDQFSFALEMRTSTLIISALAIFGVALLSQIPGLRAVRRLDIAEVVRERAA
jgi:putative ABC transport system permease protein